MEQKNEEIDRSISTFYMSRRQQFEMRERNLTKLGVTQGNFAQKMLEGLDRNDLETVKYIMVKYVLPSEGVIPLLRSPKARPRGT